MGEGKGKFRVPFPRGVGRRRKRRWCGVFTREKSCPLSPLPSPPSLPFSYFLRRRRLVVILPPPLSILPPFRLCIHTCGGRVKFPPIFTQPILSRPGRETVSEKKRHFEVFWKKSAKRGRDLFNARLTLVHKVFFPPVSSSFSILLFFFNFRAISSSREKESCPRGELAKGKENEEGGGAKWEKEKLSCKLFLPSSKLGLRPSCASLLTSIGEEPGEMRAFPQFRHLSLSLSPFRPPDPGDSMSGWVWQVRERAWMPL